MIKKKYLGSWIWQEIYALATYDMFHVSDVPYLAHNSYIILLCTMVRCLAYAIRMNLRRHLDKSERNLRLEDAKQ